MVNTAEETQTFLEQIVIAGKTVTLEHRTIPINEVHLDPMNQRVQFIVSIYKGSPSEQELAEELWKLGPVKELYRAIKQNGGLVEPIIVKNDGTVIEGNCRTVAYRILMEQEPDDQWARIPSRVLPSNIGDSDIAHLLGELHIAGKNEWRPFEKAAYIQKMQESYGYTIQNLAEHLRMSKAKLSQLGWAYELMHDSFLKDSTNSTDLEKWSYFEEFYKVFRTKEVAGPFEDRFVKWVRTEKLYKGAQVRDLRDIVKNAKALQELDDHGYDAAMDALRDSSPERGSRLFSSIAKTIAELKAAPLSDVKAVKAGDPARAGRIKELAQALKDFAEAAELDLN